MTYDFKLLELETRDQAVDVAVQIIEAELDLAVQKHDVASFMVSGGSSPKPIYEALSQSEIDWASIAVGLVDERWVLPDSPGSNAAFISGTLLQNNAKAAGFLPMTTADKTAAEGIAEVHTRYTALQHPFDVVVMGMGTDSHTASWFPNSDGLAASMDLKTAGLVSAVNAAGCPGAGDFPQRITLTRAALLPSRNMILFITGAEKRAAFERALKEDEGSDAMDYPVKALTDLGSRLTVIWAP